MNVQRQAGGGLLRRLRSGAAPLAKSVLLRSRGYGALRTLAPSRRLAILRYHAVCAPEDCAYADPHICVSPRAFEEHVRCLTAHYAVLPLDEAVTRMQSGLPLPRNAVAITFDDGYADNLAAAQVLARYGASATFYITAGCLAGGQPFWPAELRHLVQNISQPSVDLDVAGRPLAIALDSDAARRDAVKHLTKTFKANPVPVREAIRAQLRERAAGSEAPRVMLTWDEVRQMHGLGMTIGSHTMTHPNLPSAGLDTAREELVASRARLEEELETPVTMFSYPNGGADRYMTPDVARLVKSAGYKAATTSRNAFAGPDSDPFALERIQVSERLEDLLFALEVERFAFRPRPRPRETV